MKKSIVRPDGTKEEVEGSAEEIAEYERKSRGEVKEDVKKPGLLTDVIERQLSPIPMHTPECEITVASRGWWCVNPPRCTCGLFVYPAPGITYRYQYLTWPITTGKIQIGDVIPDPYIVTCDATRT